MGRRRLKPTKIKNMKPKNRALWEKVVSLKDCLSHLKQVSGRRRRASEEDSIQDPFVRDEAKLLLSKTYRLMGDKTQVFTQPNNSLVRTRQSHVMEVVANSVIMTNLLGLNTNLVRAAAIGHDVGHVPFGHQGEAWMAKEMGLPNFCHEIMGPVLEFIDGLKLGDPFLILALMTDKNVLRLHHTPMKDMATFNQTSVSEIVPHLNTIGKVDLCDPDLNW